MSIEWLSLAERFRALFGGKPELYRAPGRVNLIGEHTAWLEYVKGVAFVLKAEGFDPGSA
jgi:galactokinase